MRTTAIKNVTTPGAIDIGLSCLGCVDSSGARTCAFFDQGLCTTSRGAKCMKAAMVDHSEAQAEIVLASISVMARTAKSGADLRKHLFRVERAIESATAA